MVDTEVLDYGSISKVRVAKVELGSGSVDQNILAAASRKALYATAVGCKRAGRIRAGRIGEDMNKLKFGNSMNAEGGLSSRTGSFTKRFLAMTGSAALIAGGVSSVFMGTSAAYATTLTATSGSYQIGTGAVSGVSVSVSGATTGMSGIYTVQFVATNAIASGDIVTVNDLGGPTVSSVNGTFGYSGGASMAIAGLTTSTGPTNGTAGFAITAPEAVPAGSTVTIVFSAKNGSSGTYTPVVSTNSNPVATAASSSLTIAAAAPAATLTDSISPTTFGATATLTLGVPQFSTTGTSPAATDVPAGSTITIGVPNGAFTGNAADYTITNTTTNTSQTPTSAVQGTGNASVVLTTSADIPVGDSITITARNFTNPPSGTATPTVSGSAALATATSIEANVIPASGTAPTFTHITLGTLTSVTGVSFSASPTTVSASSSFQANFTATTAVSAGGNIFVTLAPGSVVGAQAVVTDLTNPLSETDNVTSSTGTGSATKNVATIPLTGSIKAGDVIQVTLLGVTNASAVGSATASISTTGDSNAVTGTYQLTAATSTTLTPTVSPSNVATGVLNNYTITNVSASAAYATGAAAGTSQIELFFQTGTSFPTAVSQYTINDITNSAESGAPATVTPITSLPTGYTGGVDLTVSKAIASGDQLSIVVDGVTNPGTASLYNMGFIGLNAATQAVAPTLPSAAMTYPNGAFVQSGGQIDVIAGGYGFGIATPASYAQIAASDMSSVVSGSFPTTTAPRAGTLIQVAGSAGIWVVGTDGKIYQFSSPTQFLGDGYSPMQVVEVPSAGGLTVGVGAPPTAAATKADGSIQNFGGTLYVFDGGVAFGIPSLAVYSQVEASTMATPIIGSGSAPMSGTIADGSILQVAGTYYVTSGGKAFSVTSANLTSNGYTTMYSIVVPSLGSVQIA